MPSDGKHSWYQSLERLVRYKLFVPIKRSKQPPEHSARGVSVGMFWAMTPFFGLQMTLVFLTWLFTRKVFKWDFALIPGLAWTWLTNVFTLPPFFYAYYVTGQIAMGNFSDIGGFDAFRNVLRGSIEKAGEGFWDQMIAFMNVLWAEFGLALSVGSAIWAVVGAWAAYYLTLRFVIQYRARRNGPNMNSDMTPAP